MLVGQKVFIHGGGTYDCQQSCQTDNKCKSWTWSKLGSLNSETCIHNYGDTVEKIFVGPASNVVSGAKFCGEYINNIKYFYKGIPILF